MPDLYFQWTSGGVELPPFFYSDIQDRTKHVEWMEWALKSQNITIRYVDNQTQRYPIYNVIDLVRIAGAYEDDEQAEKALNEIAMVQSHFFPQMTIGKVLREFSYLYISTSENRYISLALFMVQILPYLRPDEENYLPYFARTPLK